MIAYFKSGNSAVRCRVVSTVHDGNPNQQYPTGLYLTHVKVLDDSNPTYEKGEEYTFSAQHVFRLSDGEPVHNLAKSKSIHVGSDRSNWSKQDWEEL